jgi:protein-S-isoprenylcysteine O-methyltransferase Ste14
MAPFLSVPWALVGAFIYTGFISLLLSNTMGDKNVQRFGFLIVFIILYLLLRTDFNEALVTVSEINHRNM